ncbi:hypothetical protein SAMN05444162_1463 [Paenibacillaceae bacterium GAS479]|nr:hypothetical protein SAMN05444162_1463 [Paenibacillaceae bacterium GAS479]
MEQFYKAMSSDQCLDLLKADLPLNLKQAVLAVLESGPDSTFSVFVTKLNYIYRLGIIEHNRQENFTVCHCFSTDTISASSDNYTHVTISLPDLELLYYLAAET